MSNRSSSVFTDPRVLALGLIAMSGCATAARNSPTNYAAYVTRIDAVKADSVRLYDRDLQRLEFLTGTPAAELERTLGVRAGVTSRKKLDQALTTLLSTNPDTASTDLATMLRDLDSAKGAEDVQLAAANFDKAHPGALAPGGPALTLSRMLDDVRGSKEFSNWKFAFRSVLDSAKARVVDLQNRVANLESLIGSVVNLQGAKGLSAFVDVSTVDGRATSLSPIAYLRLCDRKCTEVRMVSVAATRWCSPAGCTTEFRAKDISDEVRQKVESLQETADGSVGVELIVGGEIVRSPLYPVKYVAMGDENGGQADVKDIGWFEKK